MKSAILTLISSLDFSLSWVKELSTFLSYSETFQISENPGIYSAKDLISELNIRLQNAEKSNIETNGLAELMITLSNLNPSELILNYAFKNKDTTGVVYLDEAGLIVYGAVLVRKQNQKGQSH